MAMHMTQFSYFAAAVKGLVDTPQNRRAAVEQVITAAGGTLEDFYLCFGDYDGVALASFPSNVDGAAALLAIASSGSVTALKTTVLMSAEDGITAMEKAKSLRDSFAPATG